MSGDNLLQLRGVTKSYLTRSREEIHALADVTLDVERERFLAVVGPTGCGKTTLLRLIAGLEVPDQGTIEIGLTPKKTASPCAYLTQEHSLFPWLPVRKNIEIPMIVRGVYPQSARRMAEEVAASLGLGDYLGLYPHELSGGLQQRTAMARLLTTEASVWLMDEPFSSLDEKTRHALQHLLLDIQKQRRITVIFVTHTIDEAVYLADQVLVLSANPGRIVGSFQLSSPKPRNRMSEDFGFRIEQVRQIIERVLA